MGTIITAPLFSEKKKIIQSASAAEQGRLAYWLNAEDAPEEGKYWVDRIQGYKFNMQYSATTSLQATYDATNKLYLCPNGSFLGASLTKQPPYFGHHWRIWLDIDFLPNSPSGYVFDVGSVTNADKALGLGVKYSNNNSAVGINWKLQGNDSNPISISTGTGELIHILTYPLTPTDSYVRVSGWFAITADNNGKDKLEVMLNNGYYRVQTPFPRVEYGPPWASNVLIWSLGNSVQRGSSYYCNCKLREFKIYIID